VGPPLG